MRITADIIEEEYFLISKELSHLAPNSAQGHGNTQNVQQTETVQEMTKKFQDLKLSDIYCPSSQNIYSFEPVNASGSTDKKMSELSDASELETSLQPQWRQQYMTMIENVNGASGSTGKRMSDFSDALEHEASPPPQWLLQYMTKMKHDIKKELLEELLNISPDFRHSQLSEAETSKRCPVVKEESQIQYQGEIVHNGIYCDNCDQLIHGIRYKCGNCSDFDLCQECESLPNVHNKNHIFLKIRYPFALRMYQKQKWQELMSPMPMKPSRHSDASYFKNQSKKLYEAKFLCDETVPDSTVIPPSTIFVKSWKVMNSGTRVWTHATKLHLIQGSADLYPSSEQVDVPHLKPGEEGIVSVLFTSPSSPGVYRSHWNFCHKSRPFGHIVWCHIIVKSPQEELRTQQVSSDSNVLSEKIINKQEAEVTNIAQVLTAVKEDREEDNMVPRKLIVNSHTATPNNTPFVLTPPKSPDHESLTKSVREITSDKTFSTLSNESDNEDDECSVVSISSSDSETEFVVIPMPKCFNLSESFVSEHLQRLSYTLQDTENSPKSDTAQVGENAGLKHNTRKTLGSETVSQETGVPELSENLCEPLLTVVESLVGNKKTTHISHVNTDGTSSEISVIESGCSSPTVENATQTFESINVKLSSDSNSQPNGIERIQVRLADVAADAGETPNVALPEEAENLEQIRDIPCSTTFPKFPVEGITTDVYESASPNNLNNPEERTIQVLPEGLVIGALSAAASVYNTARAVISTIQNPRTENVEGLSLPLQRVPTVQQNTVSANRPSGSHPMDQLIDMGFCNRQQNEMLLKKHKGDVALVVAELVNMNDNDWYASRHIPSSPPGFLD